MSPRKSKQAAVEVGEPKLPSFVELGKTEQDVMVQLAQTNSTGLVELAASLWRTTPDWAAFDPYPMLTFVIESLGAHGLVKYRLVKPFGSGAEVPHHIRLAPLGWVLMGYPHKVVEVGSFHRHDAPPAKRTDGTNYRNHPFTAQGGPIETDTFSEHRFFFPNHIHNYGDSQMATEDGPADMTRVYTKVTPEVEATVIAARAVDGMLSYTDIAERTGVPERTVKYILTELPRLRRISRGEKKAEGSLKQRIMWAIEGLGEVKDVPELRRILGMADSDHDVMHVLHALHTQGKLDFTERGNGMGTATVVNIHLPKRGAKKDEPLTLKRDEPMTVIEPEATAPEDEAPKPSPLPSAPGLDDEGYPLLDELLNRERDRLDHDTKAMAYVEAAEAIEKVDPEMAKELMAKADAFNVTYPSPLEREYLRYVADHT